MGLGVFRWHPYQVNNIGIIEVNGTVVGVADPCISGPFAGFEIVKREIGILRAPEHHVAVFTNGDVMQLKDLHPVPGDVLPGLCTGVG